METYNHSTCSHCGNDIKKPYDIIQEIKNILNSHVVPLSIREIQRYLENANYDKLNQYIIINDDHLQQVLDGITLSTNSENVISMEESGHKYYSTNVNIRNRIKGMED